MHNIKNETSGKKVLLFFDGINGFQIINKRTGCLFGKEFVVYGVAGIGYVLGTSAEQICHVAGVKFKT